MERLKENKRNNVATLKTSYTYNVRSWLKSITGTLFSETLYYNDASGTSARYNGNIGSMSWRAGSSSATLRNYTFRYDNLSRLTGATYSDGTLANYSTSYTYDKHGNIKSLIRYGQSTASAYARIDSITTANMNYDGNRLTKVDDLGTNPTVALGYDSDFRNRSSATTEYTYDANGNMTQDLNKGISTNIVYNVLNLPRTVTTTISGSSVTNTYNYAVDGRLISSPRGTYCENMIYQGSTLKRILVDGGYIEIDGTTKTYHFYLQDHLGSNRVVANANSGVQQVNHYYPYGMLFADGSKTSWQPYLYSGKEFDKERSLNWYDFHARQYSYDVPRFTTMDPMAEKYPNISPYAYCKGNPVNRVDITGKDDYMINKAGYLFLTRKTTDSFDRLINSRNTNVFTVVNNKGLLSSMRDMQNTGAQKNPSKEFYGKTESISDAITVFKFASENSAVEWKLDIYNDNGKATASIATKHSENRVQNGEKIQEELDIQGIRVIGIHSHPYNQEASQEDMDNTNATYNATYHKGKLTFYDNQNNNIQSVQINTLNDLINHVMQMF